MGDDLSLQDVQTKLQSSDKSREQGLQSPLVRARKIYWLIVVVLGFLQAWSHRLQISHDGVGYLDVADNYARGAWSAAINGYWSPLYSWLLAPAEYLRIPRLWESTYLHLLNFAAYLCAYRTFEFFLQEMIGQQGAPFLQTDRTEMLSTPSWRLLGLGLFLYSSLYMANHGGSTPDIFVVLFTYLAMGLLLRILSSRAAWGTFISLGVVLACAYFAKTAMFPLAFIFLGVAAVSAIRAPTTRLVFLLAPIAFMMAAAPWVIALSRAKGRATFGDTGRLAYARLVGPQAEPLAWGGQTDTAENLAHPPRRLGNDPPVYEFAVPVPGTFPLWYDGSYWLEGTKVHFSLPGQLRVLRQSASTYAEILNSQREYLALFLILLFAQGSIAAYPSRLLRLWAVWLPSFAGLCMYALVYLEPRYVAPFVVVLWLTLFAALRLPDKDGNAFLRFSHYAVIATVLVASGGLLRGAASDIHSILRPRPNEQFEVARGLEGMGIAPGSHLSLIGTSRESFYWARLARLQIISIIPNENVYEYWFGSSNSRGQADRQFVETGAIAIVTDAVPAGAELSGWDQVGQTSYYIHRLPRQQ